MRSAIVLLTLLAASISSSGQFKTIAESPAFDEPPGGDVRLLQMKSGYTLYIWHKFKAFDITVYDENHKLKTQGTIPSGLPSSMLSPTAIAAVFELNGNLVLFTETTLKRQIPVLHRIVINGKTGALIQESEIYQGESIRGEPENGYLLKHLIHNFAVRKDPYSDNYAVAAFNGLQPKKNAAVELIYFDKDNKEQARATYQASSKSFEGVRYIDMAVLGQDNVSLIAYSFTEKKRENAGELQQLKLKKNTKQFEVSRFDVSDFNIKDGIIRYNPHTKDLVMLCVAAADKKNTYGCFVGIIDPAAGAMKNLFNVFPVKADEKSREVFGRRDPFDGLPQNLYINADGGFSIVYENTNVRNKDFMLGHNAISQFDRNGTEVATYLAPKSHEVAAQEFPMFYQSNREQSATPIFEGSQFKSFYYLPGARSNYILFNDHEKNEEKIAKGDITTIKRISDCDGFFYKLEGKNVMPPRKWLFENTAARDNNIPFFAVSDYDPVRDVYVTTYLKKEGSHKEMRVVWMKPL